MFTMNKYFDHIYELWQSDVPCELLDVTRVLCTECEYMSILLSSIILHGQTTPRSSEYQHSNDIMTTHLVVPVRLPQTRAQSTDHWIVRGTAHCRGKCIIAKLLATLCATSPKFNCPNWTLTGLAIQRSRSVGSKYL